jgi:hypothetical protein
MNLKSGSPACRWLEILFSTFWDDWSSKFDFQELKTNVCKHDIFALTIASPNAILVTRGFFIVHIQAIRKFNGGR